MYYPSSENKGEGSSCNILAQHVRTEYVFISLPSTAEVVITLLKRELSFFLKSYFKLNINRLIYVLTYFVNLLHIISPFHGLIHNKSNIL